MQKIHSRHQSGDTIVEVLLAMIIVAAVLGSAFVTVNLTLGNAKQADEHQGALKAAESQLERLASVSKDSTSPIFSATKAFCIDSSNVITEFVGSVTSLPAALGVSPAGAYPSQCETGIAGYGYKYYTGIIRNGTIFTAYASWEGQTGDVESVDVTYRVYPGTVVSVAPPSESSFTPPAIPPPTPGTCNYFFLNDEGISTTQLVKVDPVTRIATKFGADVNYDIEGFDLAPDGFLYGIGGGNGSRVGRLFKIDTGTGAYTEVGYTNLSADAPAASMRPTDPNTLWAWRIGEGLTRVNIGTAASATEYDSTWSDVEAIAWNATGSLLYIVRGDRLYTYDPGTKTMGPPRPGLPDGVEGLEVLNNGRLLFGIGVPSGVNIYLFDPVAFTVVDSELASTSYTDIESIAYPESCPVL